MRANIYKTLIVKPFELVDLPNALLSTQITPLLHV